MGKQQALQKLEEKTCVVANNLWGKAPEKQCKSCLQTTHMIDRDCPKNALKFLAWSKTKVYRDINGRIKDKIPVGEECYACYSCRRSSFPELSQKELIAERVEHKGTDAKWNDLRVDRVRRKKNVIKMELETAMSMMRATKMQLEKVDGEERTESERMEALRMEVNKKKTEQNALKMHSEIADVNKEKNILTKVILQMQIMVDELHTKQDALKMELDKEKAEKNARYEKWEVEMEVEEERNKVIEEFIIADRQRGPGSAELENEKTKNEQAVLMYKAQSDLLACEKASRRRETASWEITRKRWRAERVEMKTQLYKQSKGAQYF